MEKLPKDFPSASQARIRSDKKEPNIDVANKNFELIKKRILEISERGGSQIIVELVDVLYDMATIEYIINVLKRVGYEISFIPERHIGKKTLYPALNIKW